MDRYFVLVYVPKNVDEAPAYSILSSKEMSVELKQEQERAKQAEINEENLIRILHTEWDAWPIVSLSSLIIKIDGINFQNRVVHLIN
jgi:hypothetical protein